MPRFFIKRALRLNAIRGDETTSSACALRLSHKDLVYKTFDCVPLSKIAPELQYISAIRHLAIHLRTQVQQAIRARCRNR
jgi:hypothetical protein